MARGEPGLLLGSAAGSVHGIVFEYRCLQIRQDGQKITPGFWLVGDKVDHLGASIPPTSTQFDADDFAC